MKTSIINMMGKKYFVVDTEIKKADYRDGITSLKVKDDKGVQKFCMCVNLTADVGAVVDGGISVNGVNDEGNFVAYMPVAAGETVEDVKKAYGAKLVAAAEHLAALKQQMVAEASAIDGIFDGIATDALDAE